MSNFNSKEYTWCNIKIYILGKEVAGLRGIEYKSKKAKEVVYASGNMGRAVQHGKREYDGTITVLQSELIALNIAAAAAGHKDALDLDFDIIVAYTGDNGVMVMDKIVNASITELPVGMKEGDFKSEHALPFIAMDVKNNIPV